MELAKVTGNLQVGPAATNLLPSVTGDPHPLSVAVFNKPKIFSVPDEEIKQAIRYAMLLVGISEQRIKDYSNLEKQILINYIRKHFPGHTCDEIRLAFEKAIAGELNIEMKDVKAYNNFSVLYFGSIMRAYREWAKVEMNEGQVPQVDRTEAPAAILSPEEQVAHDKESYEFWKTEILGGLNVDFIPSDVFGLITRVDNITPSAAGTMKALLKAQGHILSRITSEKAIVDEEKKPARYRELVELSEKINGEIEVWQEIPVIQKTAKAFWCQAYFLHISKPKDGTE